MFLNHFLHFVRLNIADDRQHGVVGRVVSLEEVAHVVDGCGVDLRQITVAVVRVVPIGEGVFPKTDPFEELVWLVQHVDANFLADDRLLVLKVFCADVERAHAVRFEPQSQLDAIAGQRFEIIGVIEIGVTVETPAICFDELGVLKLLHVCRSLKHHVLEEMRESGASFRLETKTHVVIDSDCNDRRHVIFGNHDFESVRQLVIDHRNVKRFGAGDRRS